MKKSQKSTQLTKKSISFVIPCLNEEKTLPYVLEKLNRLKTSDLKNYKVEILVSDNGSTDNSISVSKKFGARVENCPVRGYGAALDYGIRAAEGEIIIFADADDTYDFLESPLLIQKMEEGNYDLVMGSRLHGTVHKGAMPFLHRYLGTPVINFIINLLYAKKTKVLDANCGFRCFTKKAYLDWDVKSTGMEFASEMLIKSLIHETSTAYVPVSLYPDKPGRTPHLKTWRDGMRHLLRILLYSPVLFQRVGASLMVFFLAILVTGYFTGIVNLAGTNILGIHSLLLSSFFVILGQAVWSVGLFVSARGDGGRKIKSAGMYRFFLNLEEDSLFYLLFGLTILSFIGLGSLFMIWMKYNFQFLKLEKEILLFMTFFIVTIQTVVYALAAHILKRAE